MKEDKEQKEEQRRRDEQQRKEVNQPHKQDEPHKKHGVPEDEEEGSRLGGLGGVKNFKRNMGCGG